jgi:NTP pyrophosphatase (non-canonical NTP hydrolase)
MTGYIDTERIQRLSDADKDVPLYQKVIKLSEESGELSQAFLKFDKAKNTSASAGGKVEDVLEEACDVLNVTIDIINALTKNKPVLELYTKQLFQKKLDKWEAKQNGIAYIQKTESIELNG